MICEICKLECRSGQALAKHIHIKHNIDTKEYYDKYIKTESEGICPICNQSTPFFGLSKGYQKHCSAKCAANNENNVFKNRNPKKDTSKIFKKPAYEVVDFTCKLCNAKYTNKISVSNHIRKTHKMTLSEYWLQYQTGKCKCGKPTKLSTLGFEPYCSVTCRNLALYNSTTNIEKTNKKRIKALQERKQYEQSHNVIAYTDVIKLYGQGWRAIQDEVPMITIAGKKYITDISKIEQYCSVNHYRNNNMEQKLLDSIKSVYSGNIMTHTRKIIAPLELDIYIPDLHLAIEYNGTYFHSIEMGTSISYHLDKSITCRNKNIRLIHIYGFEDFNLQIKFLQEYILGQDNYPKNDFNKNNLITDIPKPTIIYTDNRLTVYGAGPLL